MLAAVMINRSVGWGLLGALLLAGTGCDRVKKAAGSFQQKAREAAGVKSAGQPAPEWEPLIDRTEQGYRFRRDLSFPEKLRCTASMTATFSRARVVSRSALGEESAPFAGTVEQTVVAARDGAVVDVRIERARFKSPMRPGEDGGKTRDEAAEQGEAQAIEGLAAQFVHRKDGWRRRGGGNDFKTVTWADTLAEGLEYSVQQWALVPRSPWFGEKRLLPGAEITLRDQQISLIEGPGVSRGAVTLRFDSVTAIDGHPCGLFIWRGDFGGRKIDVSGEREELEMSIDEGRLWCSLVHPLVLRQERKGTLTAIAREPGGALRRRLQGAFEETLTWRWEKL